MAAVLCFCLATQVFGAPDDQFILGYSTALLEQQFKVKAGSLQVKDGVIVISAEDLPATDSDQIVKLLQDIVGVVRVEVIDGEGTPPDRPLPADGTEPPATVAIGQTTPQGREFLPSGRLFDPLMADPHSPRFSLSYQRHGDDPELENVASVSLGATIDLYEDDFPGAGRWQSSVQAAVFSIFDLDAPSDDLVNADYWLGLPFSYRYRDFSAMVRLYHQSSHLGDEFLLRNRVDRINVSYEGVDARVSYDLFKKVARIYAGGGYILRRDPEDLGRWSAQGGLELRSPRTIFRKHMRPVAAVDLQHREDTDWDADVSVRAGVQFEAEKLKDRNLQLMLEYYHGHSPHGQFFDRRIEYWGVGIHFHYD
jgi:hypothetical protein